MPGSVSFSFDPRFPFKDVAALGQTLQTSGHLVPGFIPPSTGYLDIAALRYGQDLEGWNFVVMADRNFIPAWPKPVAWTPIRRRTKPSCGPSA